jgi:hypothetical protein
VSDHAQQIPAFTRRTVLRGSLLAGIGAAAVVGASAQLARTAQAATLSQQPNWVWCNVCMGLFYCGSNQAGRGWCPYNADGAPHADETGYASNRYVLYYDGSITGYQGNWFWCSNCASLFHGAGSNPKSYGVCPVGDGNNPHDGSTSFNSYLVANEEINGQPGWLWCRKCSGLFYAGTDVYYAGMCPINGGDVNGSFVAHDGSTSDPYWVDWTAPNIWL